MIGELVTLPVRISFRATALLLRGGEGIVNRGLALAGRRPEAEPGVGGDNLYEPPSSSSVFTPEPPTARPVVTAEPAPQPQTAAAGTAPIEVPAPVSEEPAHVSEEPALVHELAEQGAEEGAGAQVTIDQPWVGYARLNAREVIARLGDSDPAELAAVKLYESANQARQTVLSAVERQLARARRGGTSN